MAVKLISTLACLLLLFACSPVRKEEPAAPSRMQVSDFGKTPAGEQVRLYTVTNNKGMKVSFINYGGIVTELHVPDRDQKSADVVLGFASLDGYLQAHPYFGAIIGRYGNRIGNATFTLDGQAYKLPANDNGNSLHGGTRGFDKRVWNAGTFDRDGASHLELTYLSKDGEEGYPGNLNVKVTYSVPHDANELRIAYEATTDKPTVVNLTNHSYFNLAGQGEGDILKHWVRLEAARFTPVDKGLIPTGELRSVKDTPFDFIKQRAIGERINQDDEQIKLGRGYDHNFVLDSGGGKLAPAAWVHEPKSGRVMEVHTTEPGIQFYTGNFLDGKLTGKGGKVYQHRFGFCLETQHFPDSPNKPAFPSTVLRPGTRYETTTVYRFRTE